MKKVLILTLEQGENYGGMLQAYALQRHLEKMGIYSESTWLPKRWWLSQRQAHALKSIAYPFKYIMSPKERKIAGAKTQEFVDSHIRTVSDKWLMRSRGIGNKYSAVVVGSDQVWRPEYVDVRRYLLKDIADDVDIKRISYSASFGRGDLAEFNRGLIRSTASLAARFDAISVREDSGVKLVKDGWGMNATCHVDPTLLLSSDEFIELIKHDTPFVNGDSSGKIFTYILDRSDAKTAIVNKLENELGLDAFDIIPQKPTSRKDFYNNISKYQLPPVPQWLKSFVEAKFIVTDSFHGTAFAIIFNKPFIAIGNKDRGVARFESLLRLVGLENRLVSDAAEVTDSLLSSRIDWNTVEKRIESERQRSNKYLKKHLA